MALYASLAGARMPEVTQALVKGTMMPLRRMSRDKGGRE